MEELSASACVILGLIARLGPMTPYELKARAAETVGQFWSFPHAQLYREPPRLVALGLLDERAEQHGRRRRVFHLTGAGREALERWLSRPETEHSDLRDPALLKLAFADQGTEEAIAHLARAQVQRHSKLLGRYERVRRELDPTDTTDRARARVLDLGLRYERLQIEFWGELRDASLPDARTP